MRHYLRTPLVRQLLTIAFSASLIVSLPALAANVALATSPLANSSALSVAPNLMLMLDDSGSMDWDYMPDNAKNFAGKYGFNSSQCNGVYYDSDTTYTPPVKSDGTSYPNATFTAAWKDGYDTTLGVTNLSTGFTGGSGGGASGINLTAGPAFYYKYNGTLTSSANQDYFNTSSPFYLECNTGSVPTSTGNTNFTKVTVTSTSAEAQNFANWYSYYSTRMMMMKTGVGEAFKSLNNRFRIGYMSMNNNNGTDITDIAAFAGGCAVNSLACQKDKWYNKLYAASPGQSTPLRRALSQVGQLYANKFSPITIYSATITITGSGGSGGSVTSITVPGGGTELMAAASLASTSPNTIAKNIASQINSITTSLFDATASGNKVTINGPVSALGVLPSILTSGTLTFTQTAFSATTTAAQKLNGITPADPIQYSCQKNFVILSTDGYWNGAAGYKLDGTAIGNQDGTANRPMYDGSAINKSTSQVKRTSTKTAQATSQLQQTQSKTSQLQQSTSTLQSSSYPLVSTVTPLVATTYPLTSTTTPLIATTYPLTSTTTPLVATTYPLTSTTTPLIATTYPLVSSSFALQSTTTPLISTSTALQQQAWTLQKSTSPFTTWTNGACTYSAATHCQYVAGALTTVTACTVSAKTTATTNGTAYNNAAVTCAYAATSTITNPATSCTVATQSAGPTSYVGPAVSCSYGTAVINPSVTSCTISAQTTGTANGTVYNANATSACAYATTATVNSAATACTVVTASTASPYSGPAVSCSYGTGVATSGVATCTTSAKTTATTNGTVYNATPKTCAYSTTPTVNTAATTCTIATASTTSPYSGPAVSCAYGAAVVTSGVASCTVSAPTTATTNGTVYNAAPRTCAYSTTPTVNTAASSCTVATASVGPTYSGPAVSCSYGAAVNTSGVSSCSVSAKTTSTTNGTIYNATPKTCAFSTTSTVDTAATSCTVVTAASGPTNYTGPAVMCSYGTGVATSGASTCTTSAKTTAITNGTSYNAAATTCAYGTPTTNIGVGSCTVATASAGPTNYTGPAVACSYGGAVVSSGVTSCTTSPKTTATTNGTTYNAAAITCAYSAPVVTNVSTCTPIAASTTSPYSGPTSVSCAYTAWPGTWTNVNTGVCTATPQDTATFDMTPTSGVATQCQNIGVASCAGGTTCNTVTTGGSTNYVASCTPSATPTAGNSYTITTCTTTPVETNAFAPSCTVGAIDTTSPFAKTTVCTPVNTGPTVVTSCVGETPTSANNYMTVTCSGGTGGTSDTLADTAMYYYQTDLRDPSLNNCTGILGTGVDVCENNVRTSGGDDNNEKQHMTTLSLGLGARGKMAFSPTYLDDTPASNPIRDFYDVKMGTSATTGICSWQTSGACNWPDPAGGGGQTAIDDLWHAAVDGRGVYFNATDPKSLAVGLSTALKNIDQRTGAAAAAATSTLNPVANNNFAYVASYTTVKWSGNLEQRDINTVTGAVSKDAGWCVENISQSTCIAPRQIVQETTGSSTSYYCSSPATDVNAPVGIDALDCTAPDVLTTVGTTQVCRTQIHNTCVGTMPALVASDSDTRKIYTKANGALVEFKPTDTGFIGAYANYFSASYITGLSQWPAIVTAGKQSTASGTNLINYLRGQYGYEENRTLPSPHTTDDWLFRFREETFGDALESQPTYIGPPTFSYLDPGYSAFATAQANREGTVFIGANDGMLHAFNAANGVERWAYVPSMVIPNMYKLADTSYDAKHVNFVNGSATISDVCTSACNTSSAVWKTILVGGLNAGGRGYYALDVTSPNNPVFMWEFSATDDRNLGYSYGRPIITKKQDGTWVVLVTSGYDNGSTAPDGTAYSTSPTNLSGDGGGYLYILDAATGSRTTGGGAIIPTGVADVATPSGLAKFEAYSDVTDSNQAGFVYSGDLAGNLWRFNINKPASTTATPPNPFKLAALKAGTTPQPIAVAPTLAKINGQRVIFVATGQYLQPSDLSSTQQQTLYAILDNQNGATPVPLDNPRSSSTMVQQAMTQSNGVRTNSTPAPVDWTTKRGWFADFIDSKERANISAKLVQGTLIVPTIVPADSICTPGGYGWLNYFDYENGGPIDFANSMVGIKTDSTIVGINVIYINQRPIVEYVSSSDPTPAVPPPKAGGMVTTPCTDAGCAKPVDHTHQCVGSNCTCTAPSACTWCGLAFCPNDPSKVPGSFMNKREMWRELIP